MANKYTFITVLFLILGYFQSFSWANKIKIRSKHLKEQALDLKISDVILSNLDVKSVKLHTEDEFKLIKEKITKKNKSSPYDTCYNALNAFTKDMFKGGYQTMLLSGFNDVSDLGSYEDCTSVESATYNIVQLNITRLPIDIRLGLCLPSE